MRTTYSQLVNKKNSAIVITIAVAFALLVFQSLGVANLILVFAIFAIGYNFFSGYSGNISFGHALMYGLGIYGTTLCVRTITTNLYIALMVGMLVALVGGAIFGRLSLVRRDIQFSLLTLAIGQIGFYIVSTSNRVGGSNGLYFPLSVRSSSTSLAGGGVFFFGASVVILLLTFLVVYKLITSPFGKILIATRENEARAATLGFNTTRYLTVAFAISSMITGLAGGLFAVQALFATPSAFNWSTSGEVLLMTILGGTGTLSGPILGAIVYGILSVVVPSYTSHWPLILGGIFVVVVLFFQGGIYGVYENLFESE